MYFSKKEWNAKCIVYAKPNIGGTRKQLKTRSPEHKAGTKTYRIKQVSMNTSRQKALP